MPKNKYSNPDQRVNYICVWCGKHTSGFKSKIRQLQGTGDKACSDACLNSLRDACSIEMNVERS